MPASYDYAFALQAARQGAFAYIDRCTIRCDRRDDGIGRRRKAEHNRAKHGKCRGVPDSLNGRHHRGSS